MMLKQKTEKVFVKFFHNSFQNININTEKDKERENSRSINPINIHDIAFSKEKYLCMGPAILPVNQR